MPMERWDKCDFAANEDGLEGRVCYGDLDLSSTTDITAYGKVRKLMPIECWRLQGFSDEQFHKAATTGLSDAQLYKMAGNAVTVPVISALGEKIKDIFWRSSCQTM